MKQHPTIKDLKKQIDATLAILYQRLFPEAPFHPASATESKELDLAYQRLLALFEQYANQARREGREEAILEVVETLDKANVPMRVEVPSIDPDAHVPLTNGRDFVNVKKALKHLREYTNEALSAKQNGDS